MMIGTISHMEEAVIHYLVMCGRTGGDASVA